MESVSVNNLPSGTVTFLFTDIEGSTKLAQEYPDDAPALLARHNEILNQAIDTRHGFTFRVIGDSFSAAFHDAGDALGAAVTAQLLLYKEAWTPATIKVRMGIHTGAVHLEIDSRENIYSGYATLALTQRIMSAGHGGQILLSQSTYDLIRDNLPEQTQLVDMGEHRLKDILRPERLYQLNVSNLPTNFPPLKVLESFSNNLPTQLTSFIGREKEIAEIKNLLHAARLVTLTGSGGTGKTRITQEVGAQLLTNFPNGVWLIELAPLTDPVQIIPAMAQVFGLQELPFNSLTILVRDYLRDKKSLLILDNCEHLIQDCARLADDLLHQSAGLRILASSREALGIGGEMVYHTPSLKDSEATRLFMERACAVNSNFQLTENNASSIAQICSRLDGIPLAIELAAARVKLLSPEQIAARLDDRFRLLVGGSRTALPRQQTLRALIDWSYDLLSEEEKRLLQFASVFVGGWTLEALEAVSEDLNTIEYLDQLVNKSLVVTEEREHEMRYSMLETIRQYAREKLFEAKQASAARDRHFVYFDELAEQMWEMFRQDDLLPLVNRSNDEVENFRAALEWGLVNHTEANIRFAANFCIIASGLGLLAEGVAMARTAVERAKDLPHLEGNLRRQKFIARALFAQGLVGIGTGNMPRAVEVLKEAIDLARAIDDKLILGYSLQNYYTATGFVGDTGRERELAARESFYIFTHEVNDYFGLGMAYMIMARLAAESGNENERLLYFEKLKELIRETPASFQVGLFYLGMGLDETVRNNHAVAKKYFEDGLVIFRQTSSLNFQLVLRSEIGHVERRTGNLTQARLIYHETLRGWQQLGNRAAIAHQLECFGFLAIHDEEPQRAAKLFGTAEAVREKIQARMTDYERVEYDQAVTHLRSMLAEA